MFYILQMYIQKKWNKCNGPVRQSFHGLSEPISVQKNQHSIHNYSDVQTDICTYNEAGNELEGNIFFLFLVINCKISEIPADIKNSTELKMMYIFVHLETGVITFTMTKDVTTNKLMQACKSECSTPGYEGSLCINVL